MHFTTERLERLQRSLELALNQEWPRLSATQKRLARLRPTAIPSRPANAKPLIVVATVATDGGQNQLNLEPIQLQAIRVADSLGERRAARRGFDSEGLPGKLCSQRFYDDCDEMLQPGGVMVVNLHYGHHQYARHLGRIQRSLDGAMLVVNDGELSNSIVFACKGDAIDKAGVGLVRRRPQGLLPRKCL